ncbi:Beta-catenin-like protein 1 [Podosphaera aphanis]|nr:Beta-catenin-like protein 1 [Podosphaera aphanis]
MSSFEVLDKLFKKPALPSQKRKLETVQNPKEVYKSTKISSNGTPKRNDMAVASENDEDIEAGPMMPDGDEYGPDVPDDEEGRFFGGGVTQKEKEILDFMDDQAPQILAPEKVDSAWLRKIALKFEKKITQNAELRVKHENEPQKFMSSEADLDSAIKSLSILSQNPELYEEFVELGCVSSLVGLLAHENTDIAIDTLEIISELIDEDVEAEQAQWNKIVDAMVEADLLDLIVSNFARFDEKNESDRSGIYHALSVLENLASQTKLAERIVGGTTIFKWILGRIQEREPQVSQNKQYAAEVLAILLQSSTPNRKIFCEMDGVNLLLELLAVYRKRDFLAGTEEEEFVENLFDSLTCVVHELDGQVKFLEAEGVELSLIMIKESKISKSRALRLLDHALGNIEICERLVEAAGLKVIFSMFMKKQDGATTEHLIGIFASLLRFLPATSACRIRTLAKFVEKDYEKIVRLFKFRNDYTTRIALVDQDIRNEQTRLTATEKEEMADEWLSRRLDAGLFCLQIIDVTLAWLVAEDDGARQKIIALLAERNTTLELIAATINEQVETLVGDTDEERNMKDMLLTLSKFLT